MHISVINFIGGSELTEHVESNIPAFLELCGPFNDPFSFWSDDGTVRIFM